MMKKLLLTALCVLCLGILCAAADKDDNIVLKATLRGINEAPPNNTPATGTFTATIHPDGTIDFKLTFADLSAAAKVAHIHFGFPRQATGVMIFLCGGGGQPLCPAATSGTVMGTITAANVTGPAAQGVAPGDLASALRLVVRDGAGYANIHNAIFPGGEIRGQVSVSRDRDDDR